MPKISVIVPVYKVEPYLCRCVDSILFQTFTDFELILVDDGSPDNCGAICEEYKEKDDRVIVIHQENGGLSAARNAGIDWAFANSNSEWLTFIDSDDWVHPNYLEALYNAVIEKNVNISICGFEETEGRAPVVDQNQLTATLWSTEDFYVHSITNAVIAWGKLYRLALFEEIRFPKGKIHEDQFTTYKLLFQSKEISFVNAPLYAYFINESGISKGNWNSKKLDAIEAVKEQLLFFKEKNYYKAYSISISLLAGLLCWNMEKMKMYGYKNLLKKTRKQLRQILKEMKEDFPFSEYADVYYQAYFFETLVRISILSIIKEGPIKTIRKMIKRINRNRTDI